MNYIIENEKIKVEISDKGGEMQSIVLKKDGTEYLWQGDAKYWAGRAYNLFPICGRLFDGKYTYKGKTYEMNLHGFLRDTVTEAEKLAGDKISFTLISNEEIKKQYPFDFKVTVTYTLCDTKISTALKVENTGEEAMFFGFGGHPGFNVPLAEGEKFEDYYLEFDCAKPAERIGMTPFFRTGKTAPFALKDGKVLELDHSLFDNDAIFLTNMCKRVTLKSKKCDKFVRVEYDGMQNLGFWHKPQTDAPYVCIEPWCSLPAFDGQVDDLETKYQMTKLGAGETYENGFDIIIG